MNSWGEIIEWLILGLFVLLTLYVLIHMAMNRIKGKDEIEGLFVFKRKRRNTNE